MAASLEFVQRAIATAQAEVLEAAVQQAFSALPEESCVAVALSGGADSLAMAAVATKAANSCGVTLKLFHIHHGLYPQADEWVQAVKRIADDLGAVSYTHLTLPTNREV